MKIEEIKRIKEPYPKVRYMDLNANIFDDGRQFCAISYDGKWCCVGIIVNFRKCPKENPLLQVNDIFKLVKSMGVQE